MFNLVLNTALSLPKIVASFTILIEVYEIAEKPNFIRKNFDIEKAGILVWLLKLGARI